jgi:hypothetical protein
MHRNDVRNTRAPRGAAAVYRHRKLVTVRDIDPVFAEGICQCASALRRNRAIDLEVLNRNARSGELLSKPVLTITRQKDDVVRIRSLESGCEICDDPLGATWTA